MSPNDEKLTIGFETNCVPDLITLLNDAREEMFDFLCIPLIHPRFRRDARGMSDKRKSPLTRTDLILNSQQWGTLIVGKLTEILDLDSEFLGTRRASEEIFKQEISWASHLSLPAVLLPEIEPEKYANFCRSLNQVAHSISNLQLWVRVPTSYEFKATVRIKYNFHSSFF
mmetsp:Transcript_3808/g.5845  ORF Transcript_3808/g.5845 Transcript_3808/m.5845 type:complete len:170 (-) Transcript_3808:1464-1973(-)